MTGTRHRSAGAREIGGLDAVAALRHARRIARLSQRDLARRAEVSQSLIARIESRRVDPPVGQMQRLLGLCGMRWDLKLTGGGVTPAIGAARSVAVRQKARRHANASAARRMQENAAARATALALTDGHVTVCERRRRCREARLAERATQAASFAAVVRADDDEARGWMTGDRVAAVDRCVTAMQQFSLPLSDRLPAAVAEPESTDLRYLLNALARRWPCPPVALTGSLARAVWSPEYRLPQHPIIELAPLRGRREAEDFMADLWAVRLHEPRMFAVGTLRLRLLSAAPQSASMVRWQPLLPARALTVARPESRPGAACDRHAVRAALTTADRDERGRRHPPYHETWDGATRPWWIEPTWWIASIRRLEVGAPGQVST